MKKQLVAAPILFCLLVSEIALADQRPHIVLVMADDHGYGDTGFTGHPFVRTPHLDAMSEAGVVFNRFYASAPVCSPTRRGAEGLGARPCSLGSRGGWGLARPWQVENMNNRIHANPAPARYGNNRAAA